MHWPMSAKDQWRTSAHVTFWPETWLQRLQERGQVVHLRAGETDVEAQIVEFHHIQQRGGRAVVKIRRPSRQPAQNRPLDLADIGTFAGNERPTGIGDNVSLPGQRSRRALQREDWKIVNVQS